MDIIDRLSFDSARCLTQFSKGVAGNIDEAIAEIRRLRAALKGSAAQIEKLAFSMSPPNEYTPAFVVIAQGMARIINQQETVLDK